MAQYLTLLPVLLLFAVFNPIVCPSGQMYSERRDRSPYIESYERNPQYLGESQGSRSRKAPSHKEINIKNYRSHEQQAPYFTNHPNNYEETTTESNVEKNIRSVFSTNFGPGLYLFKNTASIANQSHQPQPESHEQSSLTPSNDKEFFKVQRGPNGKLSLVYNQDYVPRDEKDNPNYTDKTSSSSSSSSESFENRLQTHFPSGLQRNKNASQSTTINRNHNKDSTVYFPTEEPEMGELSYAVDTNDCVEKDGEKNGKPFCTNLRNYPERTYLEQIIKQRFSNLESFFGEDLVLPQNISQRMNNEPNEEFLCKSRTRVIYPQAGLNKDYNWLVIVNIPNYKQGIRIEECLNEGSPCGESNGLSLPNHYTATCKQSYIYRSLVAYTNDTVVKDQFKMPSCCKCVLRTG